ncbi:hypothetical protein BCR44DRAFT_1425082, partial [Catenaria anguillulae PL171]
FSAALLNGNNDFFHVAITSPSPSPSSSSSSSWSSAGWALQVGFGLQRKASGWLSSASSQSQSQSQSQGSRSTCASSSSAKTGSAALNASVDSGDVASIASSSLSLSSSADSAILLDLADSNHIELLDSSARCQDLHHHSHLFKGSPLVADPIASDDDDVLPLVHQPLSSTSTSTDSTTLANAPAGSWRSLLSTARARLGSVSSIAPVSGTPASAAIESVAGVVAAPSPLPSTTKATPAPARDDPVPTEYRLPWLGIGLPSPARRALRATILSLSHSRATFTEPLNPDFDYSSSVYSPLVTLLLAEDPQLATMHRDFWHNYLYRVSLAVTHAKLDAGVGGALLPLIRSCSGPMLHVAPSAAVRPARWAMMAAAGESTTTEASAGRGAGLVGLAVDRDVDPMFVPLPADDDDDDDDGAWHKEGDVCPSPLVIHDNVTRPYDGTLAKPDDMDRMLEYDTDAFYVLLQDMALSAPLPMVHVPDTLPESGTPRQRQAEVGEDGMMVVSLE